MLCNPVSRLLGVLVLLLVAAPSFGQTICEPKDFSMDGDTTAVATRATGGGNPSAGGNGGDGCDHGRMGRLVPLPPMPTAQLECVRLEGPSYLGYRCAAHPRGALISYQWTTNTISPYITLEPESDPGIAVLTCNSPPNLWLSANVTATVLGPLNQGSTQMLDVDCTRYEPLNFP